jgi:hypothetical protein
LRTGSVVTLPVRGLPAGLATLRTGHPACLLWDDADALGDLLSALPAPVAGRSAWLGSMAGRWQGGRRFAWQDAANTVLAQSGPLRLLGELYRQGLGQKDLLLVEALSPWLDGLAADQAAEGVVTRAMNQALAWAEAHHGPVLLLAPREYRGTDLLPILARTPLRRLAVLGGPPMARHLDFPRWDGALAGRRALLDGADGALSVREFQSLPAADASADAGTVHLRTRALARVLPDTAALPPGWQVHPDGADLRAGAAGAVTSTWVLDLDPAPDAGARALETVASLRAEHPRLLRIAVLDGGSLRGHEVLALRAAGADEVIGASSTAQDALDAIRTLAGQASPTRRHGALAPLPENLRGYLAPARFRAAVHRVLEASLTTGVEHSLVRLPLLPHVAHLDVLLALQPARDGDLVTADGQSVLVFLHGCAAGDAVRVLAEEAGFDAERFASHMEIEPDPLAQERLVAALAGRPDFTALLESVRKPAGAVAPLAPAGRARPAQPRQHALCLRQPAPGGA